MLKQHKWKLIVTSIVILLPLLAGLLLWNRLPDFMTTHWGVSSEADGWSSKPFAVFALPVILLAVHWLCVLATAADPKNKNQNKKAFGMVLWIMPVVSLLTNGVVYASAMGMEFQSGTATLLLISLMFIVIGNYLPKCKQNHTIGIKISWTLNNEENWNKTHRFSGKLWVACGLLMLPAVFLPAEATAWVLLILLVPTAVIPMVYSWLLYRKQVKTGTAFPNPQPVSKYQTIATRISMVIVAVSLVAVVVLMTTGDVEVEFGTETFAVRSIYWSDMEVSYDAVTDIEYRETDDPGVRIHGFGGPRLIMGEFENSEFGTYTRYSYTQCDACVVLTVEERILVLNGKDAEATREIYEQLLAFVGK